MNIGPVCVYVETEHFNIYGLAPFPSIVCFTVTHFFFKKMRDVKIMWWIERNFEQIDLRVNF